MVKTKELTYGDEVYKIVQFPIIEDRSVFLFPEFPNYYPGTINYLNFWREEKRRCIEGYWGQQPSGYRWMPPNLYFYANYGTIEHKVDTKNKSAPRVKMRPYLRDTEWEMSYNLMCAKGFSGFEYDDVYTCNTIAVKYAQEGLPENNDDIDYTVISSSGELKTFIEPYDYIRMHHEKNQGKALYHNELNDYMLMGSRGFGKSFYMGQAVLLHAFLFDGEIVYDLDKTNIPKIELFIGSGLSDKSSDFAAKFNTGLVNLPGAFKYTDGTYHQHPFFKNTSGSINRPPSTMHHSYKVKTTKGWKTYKGSFIKHGVFTKENPDAAAGGRFLYIIVEEVGLLENLMNVHGSNEAAQDIDGKIGISIYIGTGGNIDKVVECSIVFNDPESFNVQWFDNIYEEAGNKIGFFMPYHYARNDFKDHNGNTDLQAAHEHIMGERQKRIMNKQSSHNLDYYVMNYPIYPSEMFLSKQGGAFPINELRKRKNQVMTNGKYTKPGVPVKLLFDPDAKEGVSYIIDTENLKPLDTFKPKNKYDDPEGCPVIYEFPLEFNGVVPNDMYIFGYDPYASDDQDAGTSLGAVYVMKTYRYAMYGLGYAEIVASYVGKAYEGYHAFNENIEKLMMLYGSPPGGLFFENDRGDHVVEYFRKRNKLWLLATKPMYVLSKGDSAGGGRSVTYGYNIGGGRGTIKRTAIGYLRDWLLEVRNKNEEGVELRNLNLLNDRALLEELLAFNYEDNFDRVMGMLGCVIGLKERMEVLKKEEYQLIDNSNPLEFLTSNPMVFGKNNKPELWRY